MEKFNEKEEKEESLDVSNLLYHIVSLVGRNALKFEERSINWEKF